MIQFSWRLAALSFATGLVFGVTFALLRLPIPAPGIVEGALGVLGTCIGGNWVGPWLTRVLAKMLRG